MIKCIDCNKTMNFINVYDDQNTGYAYNLYMCEHCGTIARNNVWNNEGIIFIATDSNDSRLVAHSGEPSRETSTATKKYLSRHT